MPPRTICYRCENSYCGSEQLRCECGEPLWYETADEFSWSDVRDGHGVGRYADLLPFNDYPTLAASAGMTPLDRSPGLDQFAGCTVFVKDEAQNPTGSFKDRGSAVGTAEALDQDRAWVGTVSYGNMAMSTAAYAASTDLNCIVLVPEDMPNARAEFIGQYDPIILQVSGEYGELYYEALELRTGTRVDFMNSDAPSRVAGYETCLFEICEAFAPEVPDAIVAPVSAGGLASGLWRGILNLDHNGLLDSIPQLYFVQPAASDPITRAFERGKSDVRALPMDERRETIAHSIGNPDPPSGNRALKAARETGGRVLSVTDEDITEAKRIFAEQAGLCVEPASATPLAGARALSLDGHIDIDDDVVLVPTGTGFKEMGGSDGAQKPEAIQQSELSDRISTLVGSS